MIDLTTLLTAALSAAGYSLLWYITQRIDPTKPSPDFDPWEMGATVSIGFVIGTLTVVFGLDPITQANIGVQLVAYGGITAILEKIGKTIYRSVVKEPIEIEA